MLTTFALGYGFFPTSMQTGFQRKKKYKEAEWLSEEALQIAEKSREAKGKGENVPISQVHRRVLNAMKSII